MSDQDVDFSSIRGDWFFHMNYLINAVEQTQKLQQKLWRQVKVARDENGAVPVAQDHLMEEFIEAVRMTHSFMDDLIMMREQRPAKASKSAKKKSSKKKVVKKTAAKKAVKNTAKKAKKKTAQKK